MNCQDSSALDGDGNPPGPPAQTQASRPVGRPSEIADAVVFLASPLAAYVNATSIVVDGGLPVVLTARPDERGSEHAVPAHH